MKGAEVEGPLTRRQILGRLMVTTSVAALAVYSGSAVVRHYAGNDSMPPPAADPDIPQFEVFLELSRIVLARSDLDQSVAQRIYQAFMQEPWGPLHIRSAYAALCGDAAPGSQDTGARHAAPLENLAADDQWFVSHLVSTWYLGVYYLENQLPQRMTYEGALMYRALHGLIPAPFQSVGFGKWTEPPAGADIGP
jgi:hypothetical protein